jgi:hypothetical protein
VVVDREKKENERERKRKTLLSEKRSVLKKSLPEPTLLSRWESVEEEEPR